MPEAGVGYLLCDDLMFTSRITGTARSLGLTIKTARSVDVLEKMMEQQGPVCVLLDLGHAGLDVAGLVPRLKQKAARVVAYGSHVDAAGLRAAREAGCEPVLPRSKFVEVLPQELATWLGGETER